MPGLLPERKTLHQLPQDLFVPVYGYTTMAIIVTFPSRPPSSSCCCSNYPVSDLLSSSHLSGMALNAVPLWILMTEWIGKCISHLGKAEGREVGERKKGGRVGTREKDC